VLTLGKSPHNMTAEEARSPEDGDKGIDIHRALFPPILRDVLCVRLCSVGPVNVSGVAHFDLTWRCRDNERRNMAIETISRGDLEEQLATIRALVPGEAEGPFGPASVTWHVDREAAIFLGAGRALFLQLAHPWVAAAISEHSRTSTDPIGRFHRTFGVVFGMVFGSLEQAFAAARLRSALAPLGP